MIDQEISNYMNKKWPKWQTIALISCGGGLSVLLTQTLWLNSQPKNTLNPVITPTQSNQLEEISQAITVKVLSENFLGSGILINKQGTRYQVITNDHVLSVASNSFQIQTSDGKIHSSQVKMRQSSFENNDLAVLEFTSTTNYAVAKLNSVITIGQETFAAGFPAFNAQSKINSETFVCKKGKIIQVLNKPLAGGYQIGYTNEIEKGMSGGPLLNDRGEVIAINGMHAYPLWGNPYQYKDGSPLEESLSEQMSQYSWGIPVNQIIEQAAIKSSSLPR